MYKIIHEKQMYVTQQQTTTIELQDLELGQAQTDCLTRRRPHPDIGQWCKCTHQDQLLKNS